MTTTIKKERLKYDYNLLNKYCTENNITLTKDYSQEKINRNTRIEEKCSYENCNECYSRIFREFINNGGAFCSLHAKENKQTKYKKSCLEKYGKENSMQNKEVKEKFKKTCLEKFGFETSFQNEEVKEKCKKTCLENYGVNNASQSEEIKEKKKQTCLINHGTEHPSQNEDVREKMKQTCFEKYGVYFSLQNEEVCEKKRQTCLIKYGVEYSLQNEEVREKKRQTCLIKYGSENPMHNPAVMEKCSKNAFKLKDYTFPSGEIRKVQGYEPYGLDEIIQTSDETDIKTGSQNVPEIWYDDKSGIKRRHYVDIYIPSQNKCVEIKSIWTVKQENVLLKQEAGKNAGYNYEIWVYDGKGVKLECLG